MENWIIVIFTILLTVSILFSNSNLKQENFSTSGLSVSDRYCNKLVSVYYRPTPTNTSMYADPVCGAQRRNTVEFHAGNYETVNGVLL